MNSPNPIPPVTPLPSQWDSAVIRSLAYAGLGLVATILADIFGWSTSAFLEKGGRVIDALLAFLVIAIPLYQAYRARKNNPTPPIAGTPAVEKTVEREVSIATAQSPTEKRDAVLMKLHPLTVVLALMVATACITGCAISPATPITTAETVTQKGYATAGLYSILQARALDVMKMQEAPASVRTAIADANAKATPVVLQLTQALRVYSTIEQIRSGPAGERMAEATRRVSELVEQAAPLVEALRAALGRAPDRPGAPYGSIDLIPREPALAWSDAR